MNDLGATAIVEINKNALRVLFPNLAAKEAELPQEVVNDTRIISKEAFSKALSEALKGEKVKISKLIFLIQEKDIYDRFFVVRNDESSLDLSLHEQAASFMGASLDEFYTVFQKVSPFVFQFIGVKKETLDSYFEIAKSLKLDLEGVFPTSFLFAKFVGIYEPFFFVHKGKNDSILVASEYGGVYFSGTYNTSDEINTKLNSLLGELSTFNRERPVTNVYLLGKDVQINPPFMTKSMELGFGINEEEIRGFEKLFVMAGLIKDHFDDIRDSYFNLARLLNPDLGNPKHGVLVKYVAPALVVTSVLVAVLIFYGNNIPFVKALMSQQEQVNGTSESSPSATIEEPKESSPSLNQAELKRSELKLRVENGAGVAGVAGKARDNLVALGYLSSNIEATNAEKFDYTETILKVKMSKEAYLELLRTDLAKSYTVKVEESVTEDKDYDALIIVGKK